MRLLWNSEIVVCPTEQFVSDKRSETKSREHTLKYQVIVTLLVTSSVYGQTRTANVARDSIWVGADMQLGLSREAVVNRLGDNFALVRLGTSGDNWAVESKDAARVSYGNLTFEKGRLASASRNWARLDEGTFTFAQSLQEALDQFVKKGKRTCTVETTSYRTVNAEAKSVTLMCGRKSLTISMTEILPEKTKPDSTKSEGAKQRYTAIQERLLPATEQITP